MFQDRLFWNVINYANYFRQRKNLELISQIRRAALSVHLNIAEGSSRKSEIERKRYYEISRGSIIEIDAAIDIAHDLNYLENIQLDKLGEQMIRCFKMLTGMINSQKTN